MRFEPFNRDLKMSLWFLEILVILSGFVLVALGNRLVKLVVRAFYDLTIPAKRDDQAITAKSDNKGIAVVALDALTRHDRNYIQFLFHFIKRKFMRGRGLSSFYFLLCFQTTMVLRRRFGQGFETASEITSLDSAFSSK